MKLSDTNQYIKDNLDNLIQGKLSNKFNPEELNKLIQLSFLLNHIQLENIDTILFNYNNVKIRFSNLQELMLSTSHYNGLDLEDLVINTIITQDDFKKSFKSFIRDINIDKIIN